MGVALGSIDGRFRPLVRLARPDASDDILALLDTGFNGEFLVDMTVAAELGVVPGGRSESVELAGGVKRDVQTGWLGILWLGQPRLIEVLVSLDRPKRRTDGEPGALIGGALLVPSLVLLDYGAMSVEIEAQ